MFLEKNFVSMREVLEEFRISTSNLCFKVLPHRSCQIIHFFIYLSHILEFCGRNLKRKLFLDNFQQSSDVKGWLVHTIKGTVINWVIEETSLKNGPVFYVSATHPMCIRIFSVQSPMS